MANFNYTAINDAGQRISGTLAADTLASAEAMLGSQGVMPTSISPAGEKAGGSPSLLALGQKVKFKDIILFTKQLRTLLHSGVPISRALEILREQSESPRLKTTLAAIVSDIEEGSTLEKAFRRHPGIFSRLYCSLVNAGEMSGSLVEVLDRLSYILEHEHQVKEDIRSALAYPKMVSVTLAGAFLFLLSFVIPQFASVFNKAGITLPMPTRVCLFLYAGLVDYWPFLIASVIGGYLAIRAYFKTETGLLVKGRIQLAAPIIGPLFQKTAMSRFSSVLAILLASGVSILESLKILSGAIGNAAISREFDRLATQIEEGRGISEPLAKARYFPPLVINMVAIGEESGSLDEMLGSVAKHYDEEVEYAVKALSEAVGPILVVALAAVVGFFALSIFLPMWDLVGSVKMH